jgi:hypothetical protein
MTKIILGELLSDVPSKYLRGFTLSLGRRRPVSRYGAFFWKHGLINAHYCAIQINWSTDSLGTFESSESASARAG